MKARVSKIIVSLRRNVSNIDIATYPISKFHAFAPLCSINFNTILSFYVFINNLNIFYPVNYSMLLLNVKSLFTNVSIEAPLNV